MIEFREFGTGCPAEEWDNRVRKFQDANFQQSCSFGELGKTAASNVYRAALVDGEQTLVMAQGLIRKFLFGVCVLAIRGGPIYRASDNEIRDLKHLRIFLQHLIKANKERHRFLYINITMNGERTALTEIALREAGMNRPFFERIPYLTYMLPVHRDAGQNMKAFDVKWRNQLRRAESLEPMFVWGNDDSLLESYVALHNAMCRIKSIQSYSITPESIFAMRRHLGARLQFVIGSKAGQDVCGCAVIIDHGKAYYYYAAANEQGRNGYLSNAMVWFLIRKLRELDVAEMDMSGVDPARNWGGYHFKKGTGGRLFAYMGEWDYGSAWFLKPLMNIALYLRSKKMYR